MNLHFSSNINPLAFKKYKKSRKQHHLANTIHSDKGTTSHLLISASTHWTFDLTDSKQNNKDGRQVSIAEIFKGILLSKARYSHLRRFQPQLSWHGRTKRPSTNNGSKCPSRDSAEDFCLILPLQISFYLYNKFHSIFTADFILPLQ